MGIVNGTFDTDLSGWNIGGMGGPGRWGEVSKVEWVNGAVMLFVYRCGGEGTPFISQRFLIENTILSFDYNYNIEQLPLGNWSLVVHKKIVNPDGTISIQNITVFNEDFRGSGSGTFSKDVSQYIGEEATITFVLYFVTPGYRCDPYYNWIQSNGTVIIDNVINSPNWGTLRVSSTPGGANIYVDDAFLNITPESGSIDLTNIAPGSHTVKVTKTDYYDYTATVTVYPGRVYEVSATLNPQVGCLSFVSDPSGAKLFLSGRNGQTLNDTGFTTFKQICNLFWGDYKWKLLLEGYYPKSGVAHLTSVAGVTITETLAQIGIGCIYFETAPSGAKIFLDGTDTGKVTPDTVCNQSLGVHHYELTLSGYQPASGDVTLVSTRGEAVSADLLPVTAKGSIRFESAPAGAEIFLDGADQGQKTPYTITDVPVGSHAYTLKLDGFKDFTGSVQVLENQTAEVTASLIPLESCIYFVTSVPGAKIFVDDVDTGKVTPSLICGLSLGSHTYRLELSGYAAVTGTAGIGAGQGVVVASVLTPVEKGIGAGTLIGLTAIGIGIAYFATRKRG